MRRNFSPGFKKLASYCQNATQVLPHDFFGDPILAMNCIAIYCQRPIPYVDPRNQHPPCNALTAKNSRRPVTSALGCFPDAEFMWRSIIQYFLAFPVLSNLFLYWVFLPLLASLSLTATVGLPQISTIPKQKRIKLTQQQQLAYSHAHDASRPSHPSPPPTPSTKTASTQIAPKRSPPN